MNTCPICDSGGGEPRFIIRGYDIVACPRCSAWYLGSHAPSASGAYGQGYLKRAGEDASSLSGYFDYESELKLHLKNFSDNLEIIESYSTGRRLLDVGCASGHFLLAAQGAGFTVEGVDVSEQSVAEAQGRGLKAYAGDVRAMELGRRFDVITMWETIEHVPEPVSVLRHLRGALSDGGVLLIGTGDTASPVARLMGRRWWYLTPPDHCVYYNQKALAVVLARSGYELLGFERIWRHWVSAKNVAMKLMRSFGASPKGAVPIAEAVPEVALPIYHGTTVVAVARPR